jgi:DNA-binding MarR family transcriptional regulator
MQSTLSVSKAAASQALGGIEKKGYVKREIDRSNRRKITITLTDAGRSALENSTDALDKLVISLINQLCAIVPKIRWKNNCIKNYTQYDLEYD